ncbi:hypothetical protein EDD16DRAFT_1766861 [Pisolithus croceorrhizus]|nr:hypothetical protein EDD16DRAFT_1766861 [Pisolithus croceorrhizus]
MPHHHRHVLGWHRIVTELREFDVHPICVFDGQERSAAKRREASLVYRDSEGIQTKLSQVERRKEIHRMERTRGLIEAARLHRLQQLMRLLPHYRSLRASDRQRITETLAKVPITRPAERSRYAGITGVAIVQCPTTVDSTARAIGAALPHLPHPHLCEYGSFKEERS